MLKDVDEAEARDVRTLLTTLDKIQPWLKAITSEAPSRAWEVFPHSPLATDNRRTHPYQVSHRAWMAMSTAVDFLHCLQRSLAQEFDDRIDVRLHSYAQMGLIRGAVENACCAVWLLGPPRRERVLNRLALEWHELKPAYRLRELTGSTPPRTIEQRQQQLVELLLAAEQEHNGDVDQRIAGDARSATKALRGFDYVSMVKEAGDLTPGVGADLSEATWRMCSAFAHGDSSATIGLLAREVVEQAEAGIKLVRTSAQVGLMVSASMIAMRLTANAFELLEHRRHSPFR